MKKTLYIDDVAFRGLVHNGDTVVSVPCSNDASCGEEIAVTTAKANPLHFVTAVIGSIDCDKSHGCCLLELRLATDNKEEDEPSDDIPLLSVSDNHMIDTMKELLLEDLEGDNNG